MSRIYRRLIIAVLPLLLAACVCNNFYLGMYTERYSYPEKGATALPDDHCEQLDFIQRDGLEIGEDIGLGWVPVRDDITFGWSPIEGASGYELNFINAAMTNVPSIVASYKLTDTSMTVDMNNVNIPDGSTVMVEIVAHFDDGRRSCNTFMNFTQRRVNSTPTPAPLPTATPDATDLPVVPLPVRDCSGLRLTSPLDGLPNGMATFYWDPIPQAVSYEIRLYDDAHNLLSTFTADNTPLSVDVSQAQVGGLFMMHVELVAHLNNGMEPCTDEHTMYREAPPAPQPRSTDAPMPTDIYSYLTPT